MYMHYIIYIMNHNNGFPGIWELDCVVLLILFNISVFFVYFFHTMTC